MKAVIGRQDVPGLIIMFVIGIGLTFLGYTKIKKAKDAEKWPVATGIVTVSEVGGSMKYYPSVTYAYTVDSMEYSSNKISNINFNSKNREYVEEFLQQYPLWSEVKVYYNKLEPSEALLEPGVNSGNIWLLAFGLLLIAVPVLAVVLMKVDLKKGSKSQP